MGMDFWPVSQGRVPEWRSDQCRVISDCEDFAFSFVFFR